MNLATVEALVSPFRTFLRRHKPTCTKLRKVVPNNTPPLGRTALQTEEIFARRLGLSCAWDTPPIAGILPPQNGREPPKRKGGNFNIILSKK